MSPIIVKEVFFEFMKVDRNNELGLFGDLKDTLVNNLGLDIGDLRGQGYGTCEYMMRINKGVDKRMLELNPRAIYTPCGSRNLNLVLYNAVDCSSPGGDLFGTVQSIYKLFSFPTQYWEILEKNVQGFNDALKPSKDEKCWGIRIESIELLRFRYLQMRDALEDLYEDNEKTDFRARSSADYLLDELEKFQFLLSIVIWYNMLFVVDKSTTIVKNEENPIEAEIKELKGLITWFERFKEIGFEDALIDATVMANNLEIEPKIQPERVYKRKQSDDEIVNEPKLSPLESFRLDFFLAIVDQAISSFKSRLELFEVFEKNFGFLFDLEKGCSSDECLKNHCMNLEEVLKHDGISDINGENLYVELKHLIIELPKEVKKPIEVLKYLQNKESYPNSWIAYRVVLTIPITIPMEERYNTLVSHVIECERIEKFIWEMEQDDSD